MTHLALKIMTEEHRALATILGLLDKMASKFERLFAKITARHGALLTAN